MQIYDDFYCENRFLVRKKTINEFQLQKVFENDDELLYIEFD